MSMQEHWFQPPIKAFAAPRTDADILKAQADEMEALCDVVNDREAMRELQDMARKLRRHAARIA